MKTYIGRRIYERDAIGKELNERYAGTIVVVDEDRDCRLLEQKQNIRNHSPTGFEWGYGGSGPAQLALAICCDALGDAVGSQPDVYQMFKWDHVARWQEEWQITEQEVRDWYANLKQGDHSTA